MKDTHEVPLNMLWTACLYSLRYSFFRQTAAPHEVRELITNAWPTFNPYVRKQIVKEVNEHLEHPDCDPINRSAYEAILKLVDNS